MKKLLLAGIVTAAITGAAIAQDAQTKLPADYRSTFTNYLSHDRLQNDDQVIRMFANDVAMKGIKAGKFPSGSVLVAEIYKVKKDAKGEVIEGELGRRIRDKFALIAVMEKRQGWGEKYQGEHANGDWGFAAFNPDGSPNLKKNMEGCRACHAPLTESDHVFSHEYIGN